MKLKAKFFIFFLALMSLPLLASAQNYKYYYTTFGGALGGYDAVEYFNLAKNADAVKGKSEFSFKYRELTWYFKSQENLNKFKANPEKYAPVFGGYCAYAIAAKSKLVSPDANAWDIVDGKLYLNYSDKTLSKWRADQSNFITQGNANWKKKGYTNP